MTVEQMRQAISDLYPGWPWKLKVAAMYDDQVIAIYYSCLERGQFDKPSASRTSDGRKVKQLSIDDLLKNIISN